MSCSVTVIVTLTVEFYFYSPTEQERHSEQDRFFSPFLPENCLCILTSGTQKSEGGKGEGEGGKKGRKEGVQTSDIPP